MLIPRKKKAMMVMTIAREMAFGMEVLGGRLGRIGPRWIVYAR